MPPSAGLGLVWRVGSCLPGEPAECFGDHLIAVPDGVLVDHGCAGAGVPTAGHQFFDRRAGRGGECAARVSEIVEVQARSASCLPPLSERISRPGYSRRDVA